MELLIPGESKKTRKCNEFVFLHTSNFRKSIIPLLLLTDLNYYNLESLYKKNGPAHHLYHHPKNNNNKREPW